MTASSPSSGRTLVIGIGNPDRQDDGVGWHIISKLGERLGRIVFESLDEIPGFSEGGEPDEVGPSPILVCTLQLVPEMAEMLSRFERACFVDAHTGGYAEALRFLTLKPEHQRSPFSHHLTPQTCLMLASTLYGRAPQAVVCSVRGYEFGFARSLSARTSTLADEAVEHIYVWLERL